MRRIAYRALVLLVCGVMLAGLIAARPPKFTGNSKAMRPPASAPARPTEQASRRKPLARNVQQPTRSQLRRALAIGMGANHLATDQPLRADLAPAPAPIAGYGPPMRGQIVGQTARLDLYAGKNSFSPDQVAAIGPQIEQALRDAEQRFGTNLKHRVSIGFYRVPPAKGVRGMAYTDEQRAELFYKPGEDIGRAVTIAAHELGHHLEAQRYGEAIQRRADTILHEGMATWIAADRWLPMCEASTWRQRARQLHKAGIPLRLLSAEQSGANNAYELWASFVDFLAQRYGWQKLDDLYASGRGRAPGSANYQRVLGKSLDDLADEWRAWVDQV